MKLTFWLRKYHKWLALIIGLQALIWCVSGLYMTSIHIDLIHGDHLVKARQVETLKSVDVRPLPSALSSSVDEIDSIELKNIEGVPVYQIRAEKKSYWFNAYDGDAFNKPGSETIRQIANQVYAGDAAIQSIEKLPHYPDEIGGKSQPVWRVVYDDWLASTLYFSADTGDLIRKRSNLWRLFDFFWVLHIMDYSEGEDVHNKLLAISASLGLLLSLTGLGLLFVSFGKTHSQASGTVFWLRKIHKWVALFIGLQLCLWMLSGLMFNLLPGDKVSGRHVYERPGKLKWQGQPEDFAKILKRYADIIKIENTQINGEVVYQVTQTNRRFIVDGKTFNEIKPNENYARQYAKQRYQGNGDILQVVLENKKTTENRKYPLPAWRVDFNDNESSSLYIDASTGRLLGARTNYWRLFDFFWMLHIMDYGERQDFNNSLVVFAVSVVSFIALTGLYLLLTVFKLSDFNLYRRIRRARVLIYSSDSLLKEVFVWPNIRLMQALAGQGFRLPSSCDGGGDCGLCQIQLEPSSPVSAADKSILSEQQITQGIRLACQAPVQSEMKVNLSEQVIYQRMMKAKVLSNEFKTPFLKELVLQVPKETSFEFTAGDYVVLHIPSGNSRLSEVELPIEYQALWQQQGIDQLSSQRSEPISRAYSMANPPEDNLRIVLNVRLALANDQDGKLIPGQASSYLFNLASGESIELSGSFGSFHCQSNDKAMVLIGGGAGMAPLRSHILHQLYSLGSSRKISFFYGARNQGEIFYQGEFDSLMHEFAHFSWQIALSGEDESSDWQGFRGMVDEIVEQALVKCDVDIDNCEFYICGPGAMIEAVRQRLLSFGVSQAAIFADDFG